MIVYVFDLISVAILLLLLLLAFFVVVPVVPVVSAPFRWGFIHLWRRPTISHLRTSHRQWCVAYPRLQRNKERLAPVASWKSTLHNQTFDSKYVWLKCKQSIKFIKFEYVQCKYILFLNFLKLIRFINMHDFISCQEITHINMHQNHP